MDCVWKPAIRNYQVEKKVSAKDRVNSLSNHPLLPSAPKQQVREVKIINGKQTTTVSMPVSDPLLDPLSAFAADPLSALSNANSSLSSIPVESKIIEETKVSENCESQGFASWEVKKQQIKADYRTVGNVLLSGSNIKEFSGSGVEDGGSKKQVDLYSRRLANLERKQVSEDTVEMSQQECESCIKKLFRDLETAWAGDERVLALKLAIQLSKWLADTKVPQFYPAMFVMITDNLTKFGDMVYNRLKGKAEELLNEGNISNPSTTVATVNKKKVIKLIPDFSSADIPSEAKETCRNWFFKIACIREMIPRILIEIALLKSYRFLGDIDYAQVFGRISSLIRGVGNPICALYARLYLVVSGLPVAPNAVAHITNTVQDTIFIWQKLKDPNHVSYLKKINMTESEYVHLMSVPVEHLLKILVAKCGTKELFQSILQSYRDYSNDLMLLKHIIDAFDINYYAHASLGMVTLIKNGNSTCYNQIDCFASLARKLLNSPPPEDQKISLLNEVWKVVARSEDIASYILCCTNWVDVIQRHYSERELLIVISDCANKLTAFKNSGGELPDISGAYLEQLVNALMTHGIGGNMSAKGDISGNMDAIFTSENFLKILDAFRGPRKVAVCKEILQAFKKHPPTDDAILINCLFDIGRTLHDSLDVLSPEGEKKHISSLLCSFIDKINFGRDLEKQLNMYVECRAIFCNLDSVKDKLVMCCCNLAMKAFEYMRGNHSKKTASFVKACLAYCHITAPSISDALQKLRLLIYSAEVALVNQCLPQTDTFLKAAISLIPDVPAMIAVEDGGTEHSEEKLVLIIRQMLALLVVVPGHPDHGPFYLVKGLLNGIGKYPWQENTVARVRVNIDILGLLSVYGQTKFPYSIVHIQSNDELYGGTDDYLTELRSMIDSNVKDTFQLITDLTASKSDNLSKASQVRGCLELCSQLIVRMEISSGNVAFITKALELVKSNKSSMVSKGDSRFLVNSVEFLQRKFALSGVLKPLVPMLSDM